MGRLEDVVQEPEVPRVLEGRGTLYVARVELEGCKVDVRSRRVGWTLCPQTPTSIPWRTPGDGRDLQRSPLPTPICKTV